MLYGYSVFGRRNVPVVIVPEKTGVHGKGQLIEKITIFSQKCRIIHENEE
jgi:hypothetical protein